MRRWILGWSLFLFAALPAIATAADTLLADNKDKHIRNVLKEILPDAEELLETYDSKAVLVVDQVVLDCKVDWHSTTENKVWWVQDGNLDDIVNYVRDYDPGVEIDKVAAFLIRPEKPGIDGILDAKVQKLDKDRIEIQKGDRDRGMSTVVVAFSMAQPGDVLGVSIRTKEDEALGWFAHQAAREYPVAHSEIRNQNDRFLAYAIFGYRFPEGAIHKEIHKKHDGQLRDVALSTRKVPPLSTEAYSPPELEQSPLFLVVWRAQRWDPNQGQSFWWYFKSWTQVAVQLASMESAMSYESEVIDAEARRIAGDLGRSVEAADALYHFLHDELRNAPSRSSVTRSEDYTLSSAIEHGTASTFEKASLMSVMCDALSIPAKVIWTNDPSQGSLIEKLPNWSQLQVPLVRAVIDGKERWYDFDCASCGPNMIRPMLRGSRGLDYHRDILALHEKLVDDTIRAAWLDTQEPYDLYLKRIMNTGWHELVWIPGDRNEKVGTVRELVAFDDASGRTATYSLSSEGLTGMCDALDDDEDFDDVATQVAARRFASAEDFDFVQHAPARVDTAAVTMTMTCPGIPAPMGETWILPAEAVYGRPAVEPITAEGRTAAFYVASSVEKFWETRIPLPDGWTRVRLPHFQEYGQRGYDVLAYAVDYIVEGHELVIRRRLFEHASKVRDPTKIGILADLVDQIHEIETTPLVLEHVGAPAESGSTP